MARTADYTIQGFIYQFNKTLLEILKAQADSVITVEGIIEDVEVATDDLITAIQCKYHESNTKYSISAIYKPLLQMMHHFHCQSDGKVNYVLFAHFPGFSPDETIPVDKAALEKVLTSKNQDFEAYVKVLKDTIDLDAFLTKFSARNGPTFDALVGEVCTLLERVPPAAPHVASVTVRREPTSSASSA